LNALAFVISDRLRDEWPVSCVAPGCRPVGQPILPPTEARFTQRKGSMARLQKSTDSSSLAEVVDRILDKGIVIDAWVKVSLVGIELITVEARVVVASVETYLKYAEAVGLTASAATPA
jgi:gas vesicle structural protein